MLAGRVPSSDARMAFPSECERCRPGHTKISISALRSCNADMLILASQPYMSRKKFWEKSFGTAKCKSWLWKNILGKHFGCGFATLRNNGILILPPSGNTDGGKALDEMLRAVFVHATRTVAAEFSRIVSDSRAAHQFTDTFTHSGPTDMLKPLPQRRMEMEPVVGIEPTTDGLQNRCSTAELNWPADMSNRFAAQFKPDRKSGQWAISSARSPLTGRRS